ncbi:MAG: outer membrane protein transport protein [Myxococcales bacterium]|nr:outer membrane protein transport protein [Myxococcales bacterium]
MRRCGPLLLLAVLVAPAKAWAGNSDEVNAGLDVTLTGGAVVATTYTGAALWYNPAGIARINKASLELTGITMQIQIVKIPGLLTIETDPQAQSEGKTVNFTVVPQAITFTIVLKENLKLGVGLFNSSIRRSFVTEQVTTAPGLSSEARAVGGQNSKVDFFHISAGLAGEFGARQKVLVGGAFDIVVATGRLDATQAIFYDEGEAGFVTSGVTETQTGFGLQLKGGIQWVPIPEIRLGLSVASPSFAFVILERSANTFGQSPPVGTTLPSCDPQVEDGCSAQASGGSESRGARGGWWGVEPGNFRFGIAYVGDWGWVEADLIAQWRLRTAELDIDLRAIINGRIGSSFRLTKFVKLGLGLFTDLSPIDRLRVAPFATSDVNFYGAHLGFLFSNREVHPERADAEGAAKKGGGFSIAIGFRYSHGRGQALGVSVPAQYDPSSISFEGTSGRINEIALNLGANVSF